MTDRLRMDTGLLGECGGALARVQTELESCGSIPDTYADLVGHPGLAGQVHDWTDDWRITRTEILAAFAGLGEAANAIADTIEGVDADLARALRGATGR